MTVFPVIDPCVVNADLFVKGKRYDKLAGVMLQTIMDFVVAERRIPAKSNKDLVKFLVKGTDFSRWRSCGSKSIRRG